MKSLDYLLNIKSNYCIGCGVCSQYGFSVDFDEYGKIQVNLSEGHPDENVSQVLEICPFSPLIANENYFGKKIFLQQNIQFDANIGFYLHNYIGYVKNEEIRLNSSSGGITTWLLETLLINKKITHAIHVGQSNKESVLFEYKVSTDLKSILDGASSYYYPVEMTSVLNYIKEKEGTYAIVALPCFTKGLRLLQSKNEIFRNRIKYIISPVCGHLKTANYAYFLAWQKGILPKELKAINFRKKLKNLPASNYGTEIFYLENEQKKSLVVENSSFQMGTDWGHGMFKYPACDYCDDVVGELADISVGDAWLPQYIKDYKGHSVIIVRNLTLSQLLLDGVKNNEISLNEVSTDIVKSTQSGGIRNKRDDLQYRLWLKKQKNEWFPPKRVSSDNESVSKKRKKVIQMRMNISNLSHDIYNEALRREDLNFFFKEMRPKIRKYLIVNIGVIRFIKRAIKNNMMKYYKQDAKF